MWLIRVPGAVRGAVRGVIRRAVGFRRSARRRTGGNLAYLADHLAHVVGDAIEKRGELRLPPFDALQISFPLSGHHGTLHFRMHNFDQPDTFIGSFELLTVADDVLALEQRLDYGGSRGRSPEARLFHGVGKLFFIERFARRFHRGEKRGFGEAFWRAGFLLLAFGLQYVEWLTALEAGRQSLFLVTVLLPGSLKIENLPPLHLDHFAGGMIAVDHVSVRDGANHCGDRPDVIPVPGAQ